MTDRTIIIYAAHGNDEPKPTPKGNEVYYPVCEHDFYNSLDLHIRNARRMRPDKIVIDLTSSAYYEKGSGNNDR